MFISVKAPAELIRKGFQEFAVERMTKTLARLSHRITSVSVALTDENGPRGGVDQRCRVTVVTTRFGKFTTSFQHENPWVAMRLAAGRAQRKVLARLKRSTSLHERRRKVAAIQLESYSV